MSSIFLSSEEGTDEIWDCHDRRSFLVDTLRLIHPTAK